MQCTSPWYYEKVGKMLPCGRCAACKIARSREWYIRIHHESWYHEKSCFLTLTYEDAPPELVREDFVRFMKRLREYQEEKIKYFGCGEYGDIYGRPHFHLIALGSDLRNEEYEKLWKNGFTYKGKVTPESIRYVTNYIHKRLYDVDAELDGRVQPFSLFSRGLGRRYVEDNADQLRRMKKVTIGGVDVGMPKYYVRKLEMEEEMKEGEKKDITSPSGRIMVRKKDIKKNDWLEAIRRYERRQEQREKNIAWKSYYKRRQKV